MEKTVKNQKPQPQGSGGGTPPAQPAKSPSRKVPPLFRKIDWVAMGIAFLVVGVVYFLTLAPELTLEDCGELCTGAFYAGIPHPPGYPFWTIYSWIWTKLLPIGNVAWRVEVGEAFAAALACGLVAFVVSRGSSMLMEGIDELKGLAGKWESAICLVSGVVSGLLLGLGGTMWSESVAINRISLFGVPWLMIVLLCLLRWIYAPHQLRYLFCAMFFFGICATIHQTLLAAAMGIEIAIAATHHRLGRHLFLGNSILYLIGWIAQATGFTTLLDTAPMLVRLYNGVGILSIAAYFWFAVLTNETFKELCRDAALLGFFLLSVLSLSQGAFVGLLAFACLGTFVWLAWETRKLGLEWVVAIALGLLWVLGASFYFYEPIAGMTNPPMQWGYPRTVQGFFHALSRGQYEKANPTDFFTPDGLHRFIVQLGMLIGDIAGEFNWVVIFIAIVPLLFFLKLKKREKAWILGLTGIYLCIGVLLIILMNPSPDRQSADLIKVFFTSSHAVVAVMFGYGLALSAAYMATHYQRFRVVGLMLGVVTIVPAFLTLYSGESHTFFGAVDPLPAIDVLGLFLWLAGAFVLTAMAGQCYIRLSTGASSQPERERWFLWGYAAAAVVCLGAFIALAFFRDESVPLGQIWRGLPRVFTPDQFKLPVLAGLLIVGIVVLFVASLVVYRRRAPLLITLGLFALMPLGSGLSHWAESEQRNHWFGYWFGHDMFTPPYKGKDGKPLYPDMARNAILFGGTDPGRFCPTYMIFCDSFIPHDCQPKMDQDFDRRDVYLITQNALADSTYLDYLRAQYFRSHQHDPPFFSELVRTVLKDKDYQTNLLARMVSPLDTYFMARGARIEKRWRTYTSWFHGKDFTNLQDLAAKLRPGGHQDALSKWLFQNLSPRTQQLITQPGGDQAQLREDLAGDFNRLLQRELVLKQKLTTRQNEKEDVDEQILEGDTSRRLKQRQEDLAKAIASIHVDPLFNTNRFADVKISHYLWSFIAQNPESDTRIRLNRLLLEAAYPKDIAKSLGGVYPDREIYIPSNDDSQRCFKEYLDDAARRLQEHRLKPGENVSYDTNTGKVQVTGQVAVMSINGLLCKVIFDHNPDNEFYVEESFPLDWMYPHLTPFGIIMKINRLPVPEISADVCRRDHEFWSQYSERLIGNWITYDTPVKDIVKWIEKVYLRHDLSGFNGSRRFMRDSQAQKAFSKLRSSIAGIYAWRLGFSANTPTPPQYLPKTAPERARMIKEADFAFRQAFAFCPYSPEAVFRYVQFLLDLGRVGDAKLVVATCHKLDPENGQVNDLMNKLANANGQPMPPPAVVHEIQQLEKQVQQNPNDFSNAFALFSKYMQVHRPELAVHVLDNILANPHAPLDVVVTVARAYSQLNDTSKIEAALERIVKMAPNQPEPWFDLASIKVQQNKPAEALQALRHMLVLNDQRLAKNPKALNLRKEMETAPQFANLRKTPEFKALLTHK